MRPRPYSCHNAANTDKWNLSLWHCFNGCVRMSTVWAAHRVSWIRSLQVTMRWGSISLDCLCHSWLSSPCGISRRILFLTGQGYHCWATGRLFFDALACHYAKNKPVQSPLVNGKCGVLRQIQQKWVSHFHFVTWVHPGLPSTRWRELLWLPNCSRKRAKVREPFSFHNTKGFAKHYSYRHSSNIHLCTDQAFKFQQRKFLRYSTV